MRPTASQSPVAAAATSGPYCRGRPPGPGVARRRGTRRSIRIAALRWMPVTATTSSKRRCFSARVVACSYRKRWTAAYSRTLDRVTAPSPEELGTETSDLRSSLR